MSTIAEISFCAEISGENATIYKIIIIKLCDFPPVDSLVYSHSSTPSQWSVWCSCRAGRRASGRGACGRSCCPLAGWEADGRSRSPSLTPASWCSSDGPRGGNTSAAAPGHLCKITSAKSSGSVRLYACIYHLVTITHVCVKLVRRWRYKTHY